MKVKILVLLALAILVSLGTANASCTMNVNVTNTGGGENASSFKVHWDQSQFRTALSAWIGMCKREVDSDGKVSCRVKSQTVDPESAVGQTIKAMGGGCGDPRMYRIVTSLGESTQTTYCNCDTSSDENCYTTDTTIDFNIQWTDGKPTGSCTVSN